MTPILKWAGGKTQLLDVIKPYAPDKYNRFFEPFIGGGAVLFDIQPRNAVISDTNEQLINLYLQVRDHPYDVIKFINDLDEMPCDRKYYHEIRDWYNGKIKNKELDAICASLMVWLNKHCFNGLYRTNKQGFFNVPYNNKVKGKSVDFDNLMKISKYFNDSNVKIMCCDFEETCKDVKSDDFVYFDSPYVPVSPTADFTDYTKESFFLYDHMRLADLFYYLDSIGAKVMLSNNDVPLVRKLYSGFNIQSFNVKRMINRDASKRTGKEVIITNY